MTGAILYLLFFFQVQYAFIFQIVDELIKKKMATYETAGDYNQSVNTEDESSGDEPMYANINVDLKEVMEHKEEIMVEAETEYVNQASLSAANNIIKNSPSKLLMMVKLTDTLIWCDDCGVIVVVWFAASSLSSF